MKANDRDDYSGAVNPEYGGIFIDLSNWQHGYCDAIRVTDLDSGCGFTGAVMIEWVTINGCDDERRIRDAARCCGWDGELEIVLASAASGVRSSQMQIAESLESYGYADYDNERTETWQLDPTGPLNHDGWKAKRFDPKGDFEQYLLGLIEWPCQMERATGKLVGVTV